MVKAVVPGRAARLQLSDWPAASHFLAGKDSFVALPTRVGNCCFAKLDSFTWLEGLSKHVLQ